MKTARTLAVIESPAELANIMGKAWPSSLY